LPGKPDLVFVSRKKVLFVNGCFWHQHSGPRCKITRRPKSNTAYWLPKLERNVARDRENRKKLKMAGWDVLAVWECELKKQYHLRQKICRFLRKGSVVNESNECATYQYDAVGNILSITRNRLRAKRGK
jgi:DNA mismatch endonuclease (patch repair protein)